MALSRANVLDLINAINTQPEEQIELFPELAPAPQPKPEHDPKKSRSIVPEKFKQEYAKNGGHSGDDLAKAMANATIRDLGHGHRISDPSLVVAIGKENGVDVNGRWGHLNVGQRRMNLSNVLRGMIKRGEKVTVNGTRIWR